MTFVSRPKQTGCASICGGGVALLMLTLPWFEQPWKQQALQGLGLQVTGWSGHDCWSATGAWRCIWRGECAARACVSPACAPVHQAQQQCSRNWVLLCKKMLLLPALAMPLPSERLTVAAEATAHPATHRQLVSGPDTQLAPRCTPHCPS